MQKYIIIIAITLVAIVLVIVVSQFFIPGVDATAYAIEYSKVFGSYDIDKVDEYLNELTVITYRGTSKTYKELRTNIISAFNEKKFIMTNDSSYGSGKGGFVDGVQTVRMQSYVDLDGKSIEVYIEMQLEKTGLSSAKIKSLSSDNEFFGYLFFGKTE